MKPYIHAINSVNKFGGKRQDYEIIHDFIDSSKSVVSDIRHRAIFHSAFGIFIVEKVFGNTIINSDGKEISVRDIAEQHVIEDLGFIPSLQDWLSEMVIKEWMISQSQKKISEEKTNREDSPGEPDSNFDTNGKRIRGFTELLNSD